MPPCSAGQSHVAFLLKAGLLCLLVSSLLARLLEPPKPRLWRLRLPSRPAFASDGASFSPYGRRQVIEHASRATDRCDIARTNGTPSWPPAEPKLARLGAACGLWQEGSFLKSFANWTLPLSTFLRDPWLRFVDEKGGLLQSGHVDVSFGDYLRTVAGTERNVFLFERNMPAVQAPPGSSRERRQPLFRQLFEGCQVPGGYARELQIFAMDGAATGHGMHRHHEAWLAQLAGRKVWWLAPPQASAKGETSKAPFPYKALSQEEGSWPCAWLLREDLVPKNVLRCTQLPGEVMVLPAGWWHGTCSLDDFNVALGGQGMLHHHR